MKEKKIAKAIEIIYDSLQSHLPDTYNKRLKGGMIGTRAFHKKCVREYATVIKILADLL